LIEDVQMNRKVVGIVGCSVLALFTCNFSGCECSKSCSGCSHNCNEAVHKTSDGAIKKGKEKIMAKETSSTGLQWEVLQEGSGEAPSKGKTVTVHYTGWLSDNGKPGKKFDSSVDRGQKFQFRIGVGMVIAGWDEGVMSMKIGEKRRLYITSSLGYGASGAGGIIPPNADLIFDVELFEVA